MTSKDAPQDAAPLRARRRMPRLALEMLAFIRTGRKPQTECHDNIKSLAMVFAVIESSTKGKTVPVKAL